MADSLQKHYVGYCSLFEVYLKYMMFQELALLCLPVLGCHYTDTFFSVSVMTTVRTEPGVI
jgi:hypothetical protein